MPRRTILLAAFLILLSGAAIAIAAISENTGVALNATVSLTGPDGVCKTVTNNSATGKQVYVPASTAAEWQSFVASPPSGVTLGSCGCTLPWGGTLNDGQSVTAYQSSVGAYQPSGGCISEVRTCSGGVLSGSYTSQACSATCSGSAVGGYCWYLSTAGTSCDAICSTHNGCNTAGTVNYAGSGGTNAQCKAVIDVLNTPYTYVVSDNATAGIAIGCSKVSIAAGERRRYTGSPTTCAAAYSTLRRACACNN